MSKKIKTRTRRSVRNSGEITIHLRSSDGYKSTRRFKTLAGARKFAREMLGEYYDIGSFYAVSGSGTLRMTAEGASLESLLAPEPKAAPTACDCDAGYNEDTGRWAGPCGYCRSPAGLAAKAKHEAAAKRDDEKFIELRAIARKRGNDRYGNGPRVKGSGYSLRWDDVHPKDRKAIEAAAKRMKLDIKHREYSLALAYDFDPGF